MRTDSGMNDTLSLGFMHYTTAVSLEMSDEPFKRAPETYQKREGRISTILILHESYTDVGSVVC
ncbi:hypothetical protein JN06_02641 [Bacteroides zoogleoformans]|nr:hypothetical protein JN06_02641 [Bacteroides zoogleoformans]